MAHVGYDYEEIDDAAPRRLRVHCTPAVEAPFSWLDSDEESE
ncbi:MAG: hypothetical protein ACRCSN_14685 [Dermatophilaceae bacterium]